MVGRMHVVGCHMVVVWCVSSWAAAGNGAAGGDIRMAHAICGAAAGTHCRLMCGIGAPGWASTKSMRHGGWRGNPKGDIAAAARTVVALSRFIADFQDRVAEVEINPLSVMAEGHGAVALDCVIVWKS